MQKQNIRTFEEQLGIEFENKSLLRQALTHCSYLNEARVRGNHNERLEFLGDAFLELVVSEYLYYHYPNSPEGKLTDWRGILVKGETLSQIAKDLKLEKFILMSKGQRRDSSRAWERILVGTLEALIGAIYLDKGPETAKEFIKTYLLTKTPELLTQNSEWRHNTKSTLQELSQEIFGITPFYAALKQEGPDDAKRFVVGVFLEKRFIGRGTGLSKAEAEEAAARDALFNIKEFRQRIFPKEQNKEGGER